MTAFKLYIAGGHTMTPKTNHEYIVYVCPLGPLAEQLEHFYDVSRATIGPNTAHTYMPHCTLTGFFHDTAASLPRYMDVLAGTLERARPTQPAPAITIANVLFQPNFHGLLLDSAWLKALIDDFAATVDSPTRRDALRLKEWLHLSLAYGFPLEQRRPLEHLARELIDIRALGQWELRFYERDEANSWTCHARWSL